MGKWIKISVGKWISIAAVAVTMLWIGLMGTVVLVFVYPADSNLPSWFIFSPLFVSVAAVFAFILFEGGAISRLRRNRRTTRGDVDRSSEESGQVGLAHLIDEIDQKLKEGGELIAGYEKPLPKLAQKEAKPS